MDNDYQNDTRLSSSVSNEEDNSSDIQNGFDHQDDDDDIEKMCAVPAESSTDKVGNSTLRSDYRQFHVLDEVENESDSKDSYGTDSDVPDEEVERMLEEALINRKRSADQAELGM